MFSDGHHCTVSQEAYNAFFPFFFFFLEAQGEMWGLEKTPDRVELHHLQWNCGVPNC